MTAWASIEIFSILLFILCLYFAYVFIEKKDAKLWVKLIALLPVLGAIFVAPTAFNITGYDIQECIAIENPLYTKIRLGIKIFFSLWIMGFTIYKYFKADKEFKKQILLVTVGMIIFLLSFLVAGYVSEQTNVFEYEAVGLFGMVVFMTFLGYLIVKFKTFDIKLIATQALVVSLVILIGSQFFFIQTNINRILTAITLAITGIIGINLIRSVKREVALRESLQIANEGQASLMHFMNHQIKGRFGNTKNIFAELLTGDYGAIPLGVKPLLEKGLEEANTGVNYVQGILKGDSAEKGTLPYDMKPMDLKPLVEEVAGKQKESAEEKGLAFSLVVASGDYNITGDSTQLREAVRNLIDNSINYTPTGSISVSLSRTGKSIQIKVKDTGVGLSEDDKSKLFKSGGRGANSLKVNINATGYGLVFVKSVIEAHKGRVWAESEGCGKGSAFFIELPQS